MTPSRPRPRDATASRVAILAAARALFLQHGYAGTTLRAVAARAGVSASLVVRRFGGKRQLYAAVLDGYGLDRWAGEPRGEDALARMLGLAAALLTDDTSAETLREAMIVELRAVGDEPTESLLRPQLERTARNIGPRVVGDDAELRTWLAIAVVVGLVQLRSVTPTPPLAQAEVPVLVRALLPALAALLAPRRPAAAR